MGMPNLPVQYGAVAIAAALFAVLLRTARSTEAQPALAVGR